MLNCCAWMVGLRCVYKYTMQKNEFIFAVSFCDESCSVKWAMCDVAIDWKGSKLQLWIFFDNGALLLD